MANPFKELRNQMLPRSEGPRGDQQNEVATQVTLRANGRVAETGRDREGDANAILAALRAGRISATVADYLLQGVLMPTELRRQVEAIESQGGIPPALAELSRVRDAIGLSQQMAKQSRNGQEMLPSNNRSLINRLITCILPQGWKDQKGWR